MHWIPEHVTALSKGYLKRKCAHIYSWLTKRKYNHANRKLSKSNFFVLLNEE